jgi:hypothetical protein
MVNQQVAEVALHYVNDEGYKVELRSEKGKDGEKDKPSAQLEKLLLKPSAEFKQREFELSITLVRREGGVPGGA